MLAVVKIRGIRGRSSAKDASIRFARLEMVTSAPVDGGLHADITRWRGTLRPSGSGLLRHPRLGLLNAIVRGASKDQIPEAAFHYCETRDRGFGSARIGVVALGDSITKAVTFLLPRSNIHGYDRDIGG
jgi:hypothetical protein